MLMLIWSKDSGVKEAIIDAYKQLYIVDHTPNSSKKDEALATARNFIRYKISCLVFAG
jgi:hypothetical protein